MYMCNRNGIPCIESKSVAVNTDGVVFGFDPHPLTFAFFQGIIAVKINQSFTPPTTAVPIKFDTIGVPNAAKEVGGLNNVVVDSSTFGGPGIYLAFYDRTTDKLQLLTSVV